MAKKIEKINDRLHEQISSDQLERWETLVVSTHTMVDLVKKVNVFTDNETDEFKVQRENGEAQGIFKTWAVPVIPFISEDSGKKLARDLSRSDGDFLDKIGEEGEKIVEGWLSIMDVSPMRFWQELERWRGTTDVYDKRLFKLYSEQSLPNDKNERVAELFWRLKVAFGYASPFYHLESIVGGESVVNSNEGVDGGGALDLVGMLLPSALSRLVVVEQLDWKGLSWKKIDQLTKSMNEDEKRCVIKIARRAGIGMKEVVFAANILEWIPVSVGGKKQDMGRDEALTLLDGVLSSREKLDHGGVAREMNALIRFLNWVPLIKSEDNFSQGTGWKYAAVCDTVNLLMAEVENGGVLTAEFEEVFRTKLADQVEQLDATSARGRFLLQLVEEGRFDKEVMNMIEERKESFLQEISVGLLYFERNEEIVEVNESLPACLVGGKAFGLRESALVFGNETVISGKVLTSEFVENWLRSDEALWRKVKQLDKERDMDERNILGKMIRSEIDSIVFPKRVVKKLSVKFGDELLAVRSSSFDEDTQFNGTAAGVYESHTRVKKKDLEIAIKDVVKQFFSDRAIGYRELHGCSDVPMLAVIVQEFVEGAGGVAFSDGDGWEIVVGREASEVVGDGGDGFDSYKKSGGEIRQVVSGNWLNNEEVMEVANLVEKAEKVLGGRVDVEFVMKNNKPLVLQMRLLKGLNKDVGGRSVADEIFNEVVLNNLESLDTLGVKNGERLRLFLDENIDVDQFQGGLFRWLVRNKNGIGEIVLSKRIPRTSHFSNICINLDINLRFIDD
jgi:hypothetical protein